MTEQEYRDDLILKIGKAETIIDGLSKCDAFKMVCTDVQKNIVDIDKTWHLLPESEDYIHKIKELRMCKMTSEYIVNLIDTYRMDLERLQAELFKLDNPETQINKDYDAN